MVESATGLVLRTRPLTETSLIVHWLTPDFGRLATVATGARRPKSPFQGKLDLCYLGRFTFSRSRRSELHRLREVSLVRTHEFLRRDMAYLRQVAYCVRLLEQATETDTPLGTLFELCVGLLEILPKHPARPEMVFAFELKLLVELGLKPDLSEARLTPGAQALIRTLETREWAFVSQLHLSAAQVKELHQFLHGFLIYHLGRIPKGRDSALSAA